MKGLKTGKVRLLTALAMLSLSGYSYAFPAPGSYISNIASGDYTDETGNLLVVNSNPVSLEVQKVYALTLVQNQNQLGTIGAQVSFPHVLTNTGNMPDTYKFSLEQKKPDDFNLDGVAVYVDRDQDGLPDDSNDLLTAASTISLKPGESLSVVVVGGIPTDAAEKQKSILDLIATSSTESALTAKVEDTATVVDDAVIALVKAQDKSQGDVADVITYTLTYRNNGTAARPLLITDVLDSSLEYVANSARWNQGTVALTDSVAAEDAANTGIEYQVLPDGITVQAQVTSVAPLTSGTLSFQVKVKHAEKNKIPNTANYEYSDKNSVKYTLNSNTVNYTLSPSLGVVLNRTSTSAANDGDPDQTPDNLETIAELKPGQEVLFKNYVWNTGNVTDVYNLTFSSQNLPSCAKVRLYTKDGKTLLTDTNGDGVVDTGSLAASAVKEIKVGVYASTSCNTETSNIIVDVKATSTTSSDITDPVRNVVTKLVASSSESDLYNSDKSGQGTGGGIGEIDNSGNAWLKKTVVDGKVVFPLVAENRSTQSNNYNLYASFSAIDPQNITVVTAAGFTVKFYEGDATCSTLGKQITNTGTVAGGTAKQYCAEIQVDPSQQNFVKPIWFAIHSPVNQQADAIKDEIVSSVARQLVLTNDQQGQVSVGGSIVYTHILKNTGTEAEGTVNGSVLKFKVTPLKPDDSFIYSLYYDVNKDGKIDTADKFIDENTDLSVLTGGTGLDASAEIQLLLKVQAPSTANEGMVSPAEITVDAGTYLGIKLDILKNTDVTSVSSAVMQLIKQQSKVSCSLVLNQANVSTLTFTTQPLSVKPDECVLYKLEIENKGSSAVSNIQFQDAIPAYTRLEGTPLLVPTGTDSSAGENIHGTIAGLSPGKIANMYFMIRVNP
ncbi:hypothetical protein QR674_01790 [Acinetobacter chinensis]|uniref:DUF11 domain-containing protein n=1 Tax=Acinetobacter chinensis TaxID=2004650 RepID=A0ABU3WBD2_9GAMM|nr:hypothetical protein [Acinetobacter chinensis]MDV2467716.1 hypothetical protein [Acinetobacter chinensis]